MTLDESIRKLDSLQAELTIHPDGCPEPWRTWLIEAHEAMCAAVTAYMQMRATAQTPPPQADSPA